MAKSLDKALQALDALGFAEFDAANELQTAEDVLGFLRAAVEEAPNDAAFIAHSLGVVARSKAMMSEISQRSGLSRESLYKALSGNRDPSFSTILKVVAALGLTLTFERSASTSGTSRLFSAMANSVATPPQKVRARASRRQSGGFRASLKSTSNAPHYHSVNLVEKADAFLLGSEANISLDEVRFSTGSGAVRLIPATALSSSESALPREVTR